MGLRYDRFGKLSPEVQAAKLRSDIKPLHFADALFNLPQRHTSGDLVFVERDEQTPARRRVIAGKIGQLFIEILKAQVDAQRRGVFSEKLARLRQGFFSCYSSENP